MRSLWVRLMGAFALVILVGVVVNAYLVSRATSSQFSRYVTRSGQGWAEQMAPPLADYYRQAGSWTGVESFLRSPWPGMMGMETSQTRPNWGSEHGMEHSGMMGHRADPDHGATGMMGGDMWGWLGPRLILADEQGAVVADSAAALTGTSLPPDDLALGTPIVVEDRPAGTLLVVAALSGTATPATDFLSEVKRSTWLAGLTAGGLALVLGVFLFRQVVAPIRAVTAAAQEIAAGRLDQRVPVRSRDEVGQLASTFNVMASTLAQDRQLRQHMVADIAHELRTPLSIIQGNLEAMLDGVLPTTPQEIASLHDEAVLLARLVADLRLLSLAEAGQLKLEQAEVDLGALVQRSIEPMRLLAENSHITLMTGIRPKLPPVWGDADRISQVISNLVGNALHYTPAGGSIALRVFEAGAGDHRAITITVTDTGGGIAPADLPHVFDRFYRVDKSRSRSSGGSGIGLAIVKQLVEAHGGQVTVESDLGQGTTFKVTLPVAVSARFYRA